MDAPADPSGVALCTTCGRPNAPQTHFCAACGAPLTWHATTDPLGVALAEGFAARRALAQPSRPIITIGIWLWMLPLAVASLAGLAFVFFSLLVGLGTLDFGLLIPALVAVAPLAVGLYLSGTLLYRVTRGYFRGAGTDSGRQAGSAGGIGLARQPGQAKRQAEGEGLACLACGQPIPAGGAQCPGCGWSYVGEPGMRSNDQS
jgi:hypothetical protein